MPTNNNIDFDLDLFNEMVNEAPTVGFGPQVNFGKMTMQVNVISWKDRKPIVTPFKNQKVDKEKGEYLQVTFESDMSEFNPALTKPYTRRVDVKKSRLKGDGSKDPKALTDWSEITEASLIALLGKDWAKKFGKGVYAEWEDRETVELTKDGEKRGWDKDVEDEATGETKKRHYVNTAPWFRRVFKSKAEAAAAHAERFKKNDNAELEIGTDGDIPEKVINEARGLIQAVGLEQAQSILSTTPPYSDHDTEQLIKLANPL